ncbi:MAG TPA: hypothetical protein VEB21_13200, partial [Terriglobales bacterium]|nr:hypothetical protein [Terriglobales bacterium]
NAKQTQVKWRWKAGINTPISADFGDPINSDTYALCVYDGTDLVAQADAPAGGTCAGKPCWSERRGSFRYKDRDRTPNGMGSLDLKSRGGLISTLSVTASKNNLVVSDLSTVSMPLTVQLQRGGSLPAQCWESYFPNATNQTLEKIKAKTP